MRLDSRGFLGVLLGILFGSCAGLEPAVHDVRGWPAQGPRRSAQARAARDGFLAPDGLYVSGRLGYGELGGDFDGGTTLLGVGTGDDIFVPDADRGTSTTLAVGYHERGNAVELVYVRSSYDDVRVRSLGINGLRYLRANSSLQPYLLFGIFVPWADLDDASVSGTTVGDAELESGVGAQLGAGAAWFLAPDWSLDVRALGAWQTYGRAEGVSGVEADLSADVDAWSWSLSVGLTWILFGREG